MEYSPRHTTRPRRQPKRERLSIAELSAPTSYSCYCRSFSFMGWLVLNWLSTPPISRFSSPTPPRTRAHSARATPHSRTLPGPCQQLKQGIRPGASVLRGACGVVISLGITEQFVFLVQFIGIPYYSYYCTYLCIFIDRQARLEVKLSRTVFGSCTGGGCTSKTTIQSSTPLTSRLDMVGQPPLTGLKVLEFAGLAPGKPPRAPQ